MNMHRDFLAQAIYTLERIAKRDCICIEEKLYAYFCLQLICVCSCFCVDCNEFCLIKKRNNYCIAKKFGFVSQINTIRKYKNTISPILKVK